MLDAEQPDYVVMNGTVGGLTGDRTMTAKVGETARFYMLLDHSIARAMDKGAMAQVVVTGEKDRSIFDGPVSGGGH